MISERLTRLLSEFNLDIDDVRWHLSLQLARELAGYQNRSQELGLEIWSGRLADRLHELEERYLEGLDERLRAALSDESHLRNELLEIKATQRRRHRNY